MIVTTWIIFIFFGIFALWTTIQYYIAQISLSWLHTLVWLLSVVITALSAGVIWGGLFSNLIK